MSELPLCPALSDRQVGGSPILGRGNWGNMLYYNDLVSTTPSTCVLSFTTPTTGLLETYSFPSLSLGVDVDQDIFDMLQKQVSVLSQSVVSGLYWPYGTPPPPFRCSSMGRR